MVKLGDICKKVTNINSDFIGEIDYIDISSIDNERKSIVSTQKLNFSEAPSRAKQLVLPGDILISNVRPNLNAVAMIISDKSNTLVASTGYTVIRCNNNAFNRYVFFFCQYSGFVDLLVSQATGASYPAVNASIIKNTIIPLPALEKQHQIAKNLDTLQSIITHRRTQLEKLDLLVKARFVEMCNDTSNTVRLDTLISDYKAERCGDNKYPVLSITRWNGLILQSDRFKKEIASRDKSNYKIVPKNKLVVAFPIDEGLICSQTVVEKGIVSPAYNIFNINEEKINPIVLEHILRSDYAIQYYLSKLRGTTLRRRMIPRSDLNSMPIKLPERERQNQYLNELIKIDKSKATLQKALDEAQVLFDSLMQEYFG